MPAKIGEVIEASTGEFMAQCYEQGHGVPCPYPWLEIVEKKDR